jgi:hypothetical protein
VRGRGLIFSAAFVGALVVAALAASVMALVGASFGECVQRGGGGLLRGGGGGGGGLGVPATRAALREIPPARLRIYREAGARFDVEWPFLASIGYQECGVGACAHIYPSGCGGPMQIAIRRESACSPGPGPTIWERYAVDADGGGADPFDAADAIFTAARMLRPVFGLTGGSYADYREAACNYYGACADSLVAYSAEVMVRAVRYGFRGAGAPESEPAGESPASSCAAAGGEGGAASASRIVRIARSQLGRAESPPGSNCNPYGPCEEWCALFASWVWERAGVPLPGGTTPYAYTGTLYKWAAAQDRGGLGGSSALLESTSTSAHVLPPGAKPAPGDAIFFGSGPGWGESDHVGIVERVFPNGEITTIDGNYGDRVARVGPFLPAAAAAAGEPAPVYGYAVPPSGLAGAK